MQTARNLRAKQTGKAKAVVLLLALTTFVASAVAVILFARQNTPERWFVPGELGHVSGEAAPVANGRSYQTRAFAGATTAEDHAWQLHNGLGSPLRFSHNLATVFPPALFDAHPGYFPLVAGSRLRPPSAGLVFWNPDLGRADTAAYAANVAAQYFQLHPQDLSFSLGVNDGLVFGESPETLAQLPRRQPSQALGSAATVTTSQAWFRGRPDYSNLVFNFLNRAAEDLSARYPNKLLGALAYYWAENAPDIPVHRQVAPYLTADRSQGYDGAFRQEEADLQARWAKAGPARLGLYDYIYGKGFIVPRYHPHLLAENLRQARRLGFTDYYAEVFPNWGLDGPQPWLVAQLLFDPDIPADTLLDEYFARYFREAAVPMRRFFDRCERQWMTQAGPPYWLKHYRNESQASLFPAEVCRTLRADLDEATRAARSAAVKARVKLTSDAFGATERFVAFQSARTALTTAAFRRSLQGREGLRLLVEYVNARKSFISYVAGLRHEQPLALYPTDFSDFLMDDPRFEAASVLLRQTRSARPAELDDVVAGLMAMGSTPVHASLRASRETTDRGEITSLSFTGPCAPVRQIAGLTYGIALPPPWQCRVEPYQTHRASWTEPGKVLRIGGTEETSVFQWLPAAPGKYYRASVVIRGRLSVSAIANLTLGWLDRDQNPLGVTVLRLPEGDWREWGELLQGAVAPSKAAWVGVGIHVQHQAKDDWIEIQCPRLSIEP